MKALQCHVMTYVCVRTIRSALSIDPTPNYFVTRCTHGVNNYSLQAASHIASCHGVHTAPVRCLHKGVLKGISRYNFRSVGF